MKPNVHFEPFFVEVTVCPLTPVEPGQHAEIKQSASFQAGEQTEFFGIAHSLNRPRASLRLPVAGTNFDTRPNPKGGIPE